MKRVTFVCCLSVLASALPGQCAVLAEGGAPRGQPDGTVDAVVVWDRDGAGPLPPLLVFGGGFEVVADLPATAIAAYDPASQTWSSLGDMSVSFQNQVRVFDLAVAPNGDLIATGNFLFADGVPVGNIARFDGSSWQALGGGIGGGGKAVTVLPNGDVVVAGSFTLAGGVAANGVARWDGSQWSAMGQGPNSPVLDVAVLANGDVVIGGQFDTVDGAPAPGVARWDGTGWSALGNGPGAGVIALHVAPNGDLWAGGGFGVALGGIANGLARWDGSSWTGSGAGPSLPPHAIASLPNGDLVIGGLFDVVDGVPAAKVARWDGVSWAQLGSGTDALVNDLAVLPSGEVVWTAGIDIAPSALPVVSRIERFDGVAVQPLTAGTDGAVTSAVRLPGGDVVVAGSFTRIDGVPCSRFARRSNGAWQPLGPGRATAPRAIAVAPNGDVLAVEGVSAGVSYTGRVMRWDGIAWQQVGTDLAGYLTSVAVLPNGDVVVAGGTNDVVARWDGAAWTGLGLDAISIVNLPLRIWTLPDGRLLASGVLLPGGASLWDGVAWTSFPGAVGWVRALCVRPSGRIAFASNATGRVLEWDGVTLTPLDGNPGSWNGDVTSICNLPNGDLLVGGEFTVADGVPAERLARWDGEQWRAVDVELDAAVAALVPIGEQRVLCGGLFDMVNGEVQAFATELATSCPAAVVTTSPGCPSSGGGNTLTAELPWAGAPWTAKATGLPTNAIALVVTGFASASTPLSALLAQGQPGCSLDVTPDDIGVAVVVGGETSSTFTFPADPQLAGLQLFRQVVPIEFDTTGAFVAVTSSNALSLTIGAF